LRNVLDIRRVGAFSHRTSRSSSYGKSLSVLEGACCFIALAALVGSPIFGTALAALFLVAVAGLVLMRPADVGRDLVKFLPLLALPILAMLSTLWSDAPERTLRAAIQMLLTMMAAIVICRRFSSETLVVMLFVAVAAACSLAVVSLPRVFAMHVPLLGPYASKNAMAYAAHLLVALSLGVACERSRSGWWRLAACLAIPAGLALMYLAQSVGALLALFITMSTFPALLLIGRVRGLWRVAILFAGVIAIGLAVVLLPDIEAAAADFRQNVLRKDETLTGRTYLWDFAYRLAAERPLLGHGYYAFWRQGNIDAEGLWRYAGIVDRSGFNFHNTFIEMRVDMGWTGTALLVATCVAIVALAMFRQFNRPSVALAFLLALSISELIRATAETSLFAPFSYYTLILMATGVYAVEGAGSPTGRSSAIKSRVSREKNYILRNARNSSADEA
jgi:exopolysaccharide production protein ExoQ